MTYYKSVFLFGYFFFLGSKRGFKVLKVVKNKRTSGYAYEYARYRVAVGTYRSHL